MRIARQLTVLFPRIIFILFLLSVVQFAAAEESAKDVISIGSGRAKAGATLRIPITIQDSLSTPLGADAGAGAQIQAFAFQVSWSPEAAIVSAAVSRSGAASAATPRFEHNTFLSSVAGFLASFDESTQPVRGLFPDGDEVAQLNLVISPRAKPGSTITLDFVTDNTCLSNQDGTVSEQEAYGTLSLKGGSVKIKKGSPIPVLRLKTSSNDISEGRGKAVVRISADKKLKRKLTVKLKISGSARSGKDYKKLRKKIVIPAGKRSVAFRIKAKKDSSTEASETIVLSIGNSKAYSTLSPRETTITITDL